MSYKKGKATVLYSVGVEPDIDALKGAVSELGYVPGAAVVTDSD